MTRALKYLKGPAQSSHGTEEANFLTTCSIFAAETVHTFGVEGVQGSLT